MDQLITKLKEEFELKEINQAFDSSSNTLTINGSNSDFTLNCYYVERDSVNFHLTIVPKNKSNRFVRSLQQKVLDKGIHEDYLLSYIDMLSHQFNIQNNPINLSNLFLGSNVKAYNLPYLVYPGPIEFDIFLTGFENRIEDSTTVISLRHVRDNSKFDVKEPFKVSYTYAFLVEMELKIDDTSPDSYGSVYHPIPSHWIFYLNIPIDPISIKNRLNNSHGSGERVINMSKYDLQFENLEIFLKERNAIEKDKDNSTAINRIDKNLFGEDFESDFFDCLKSFDDKEYQSSMRDLRALVQRALEFACNDLGIAVNNPPKIHNLVTKLFESKIISSEIMTQFTAFSSIANLSSHGDHPSSKEIAHPITKNRYILAFYLGCQLINEIELAIKSSKLGRLKQI